MPAFEIYAPAQEDDSNISGHACLQDIKALH